MKNESVCILYLNYSFDEKFDFEINGVYKDIAATVNIVYPPCSPGGYVWFCRTSLLDHVTETKSTFQTFKGCIQWLHECNINARTAAFFTFNKSKRDADELCEVGQYLSVDEMHTFDDENV